MGLRVTYESCRSAGVLVEVEEMKEIKSLIMAAVLIVFLSGCSADTGNDAKKNDLTRQEKDSVLSESGLTGSGVVKRAIAVSDSAAVRAKKIDAQAE